MPKLRLKRTPEEEALHRLRKKEKKEAKRRKKRRHYNGSEEDSRKRPRGMGEEDSSSKPGRRWASSDEDGGDTYGPHAPPKQSSTTNEDIEEEEMRFRERLFDAFADDERLDSVEARLNEFAHVPDRWRTQRTTRVNVNVFENDEWLRMNPQQMDEEEYAEWIRMGMYRKTHADEYAEQQRQKAAYAARRAEAKARKEETKRLEKAAEEEREQRKRERETKRLWKARESYDAQWKTLLKAENRRLVFGDIPWPVVQAHKATLEDLTVDAISAFLLPQDGGEAEKPRKEILRETMLRFHPDKFEGRFMKLVVENERESVREGIGSVVRALNRLLSRIE